MSESPQSESAIVRMALVFYGVMALLAVGIAGFRGAPLLSSGAEARPVAWLQDAGLGAFGALAVVGLSAALEARTRWGAALARALAEQLGPLSLRACAILALASGIAEELLFRGALQPLLGWVATSLLFGLVHFVPRREFLPWTVFAVLAGFGLGWLYEATGNLLAPIVAHVGVNAINLRRMTRDLPARSADGRDRVDLDVGAER